MATGHFPNCSHNFEWYGLINHDRMITLTLQNKYDTTLPSGYPKFAYPLEISLWIRNLFTHGETLPGRFAIGSETIDRRFGVVYRDVITGSRESRVHHYDAPSFTEFWNLYCPRTIHFSWRRRASLRTLPTTLIVRDWGNNGTICDSTCAARCRLLKRGLRSIGQKILFKATIWHRTSQTYTYLWPKQLLIDDFCLRYAS